MSQFYLFYLLIKYTPKIARTCSAISVKLTIDQPDVSAVVTEVFKFDQWKARNGKKIFTASARHLWMNV